MIRNLLRTRRARLAALLTLVALAGLTAAYGFLNATSTPGTTSPTAGGRTLAATAAPNASLSGSTVTVSIPQTSPGAGTTLLGSFSGGGYVVRRYADTATPNSNGTVVPAGTCAPRAAGGANPLTCTETSLPTGDWKYTATPVLNNFVGLESPASNVVDNTSVTGDTTPPTLQTLEMLDANGNGKVDAVKATYNEALAGSVSADAFALANVPSGGSKKDVTVSGSAATLNLNEGSGAANTANVTTAGNFTVTMAKGPTAIRDASNNEADGFSTRQPLDRAAPLVTALDLVNNGGTAGVIDEKKDSIAVTYSEALRPSTICSGWNDTATSFVISANNDVTVSVSAADVLTVTASSCSTLRFGSLALGGDYAAAGGASFKGSGGNASRLTWTPAAPSALRIDLGGVSGTVNAPVASSNATLTPPSGLTDLASPGNALPVTPFATGIKQQF